MIFCACQGVLMYYIINIMKKKGNFEDYNMLNIKMLQMIYKYIMRLKTLNSLETEDLPFRSCLL
jgi:hypothetical protein